MRSLSDASKSMIAGTLTGLGLLALVQIVGRVLLAVFA